MLWMRSEARIVHLVDSGVIREESGDCMCVALMHSHSRLERSYAAQSEPAVERGRDRAGQLLNGIQLFADRRAATDQRSAQQVGVASKVLRRRVHDDVGAELQ